MAQIAIIVNDYFARLTGGVHTMVYTIIRHLLASGHQIYLICLERPADNTVFNLEKPDSLEFLDTKFGQMPYAKLVGRIFLSRLFNKIADQVDLIIDIDGGYIDVPDKVRSIYLVYSLSVPSYKLNSIEDTKRRLLEPIYMKIAKPLYRPLKNAKFIAISRTRAQMIEETWNVQVKDILYPAVTSNNEMQTPEKEDLICMLGRISPEKRIIFAINAFARFHKNAKLIIAGHLQSPKYFGRVNKAINETALQDKIEIITNLSRNQIDKLLLRSKVILSCQIEPESFNISIIEGMGMGCIPVVPKVRSGAWDEILEDGKYGFGFNDINDCATALQNVINFDKDTFHNVSLQSMQRAKFFNDAAFKAKLDLIVRSALQES